MITSSTASPGSAVRASSSRATVTASWCAGTSRSEPPNPPTGVRTGSQITASRIELSSSILDGWAAGFSGRFLHVDPGHPLGDARRTLAALDLHGDLVDHLQGVLHLGHLEQLEAAAQPAVHRHRRGEAHLVQPVVDAHLDVLHLVDLRAE